MAQYRIANQTCNHRLTSSIPRCYLTVVHPDPSTKIRLGGCPIQTLWISQHLLAATRTLNKDSCSSIIFKARQEDSLVTE